MFSLDLSSSRPAFVFVFVDWVPIQPYGIDDVSLQSSFRSAARKLSRAHLYSHNAMGYRFIDSCLED
jgi:hypothetical protein